MSTTPQMIRFATVVCLLNFVRFQERDSHSHCLGTMRSIVASVALDSGPEDTKSRMRPCEMIKIYLLSCRGVFTAFSITEYDQFEFALSSSGAKVHRRNIVDPQQRHTWPPGPFEWVPSLVHPNCLFGGCSDSNVWLQPYPTLTRDLNPCQQGGLSNPSLLVGNMLFGVEVPFLEFSHVILEYICT
jgi:hypothetical protein